MKIQPRTVSLLSANFRKNSIHSKINYTNQTDSFRDRTSTKNISFGMEWKTIYKFKIKNDFNFINSSNTEMDEYAEIFHNKDTDELTRLIEKKYDSFFDRFKDNTQKTKIEIAKDRLLPRIEKVLQKKQNLLETKNKLSIIETSFQESITNGKTIIKENFLSALNLSTKDKIIHLPNGILIHGKASKDTKNEFINWIRTCVAENNTGFSTISFKPDKPEEFFKELNNALDLAKIYNKLTGNHNIIYLEDIDILLTQIQDEDALDYIDEFKTIVEDAAQKFNTTFLINTSTPLTDFNTASIGDQRFEIKINLKKNLTTDEKANLNSATQELNRLQKQANRVSNYYTCTTKEELHFDDWELEDCRPPWDYF